MSSTNEERIPTTDYVINAESAAEMARLTLQARLISKAMSGGLFSLPATLPQTVLDIACGPGEFVLEMASRYPHAQVIGVDNSKLMIEYAQAQAKTRGLTNATFRVMDVTQRLDFTDGIFDLVNGRFLFGFMNPRAWPKLASECTRISKPGGIIRYIEGEAPISNSQATEAMYGYFLQALQRSGRSELPEGRHFATTPLLRKYLSEAGCQEIVQQAFVLDYSSGTEAHDPWVENAEMSFQLMAPFFVKGGSITQEQFDVLYRQIQSDHQSGSYYALFFFLSTCGRKPLSTPGRGKRA